MISVKNFNSMKLLIVSILFLTTIHVAFQEGSIIEDLFKLRTCKRKVNSNKIICKLKKRIYKIQTEQRAPTSHVPVIANQYSLDRL